MKKTLTEALVVVVVVAVLGVSWAAPQGLINDHSLPPLSLHDDHSLPPLSEDQELPQLLLQLQQPQQQQPQQNQQLLLQPSDPQQQPHNQQLFLQQQQQQQPQQNQHILQQQQPDREQQSFFSQQFLLQPDSQQQQQQPPQNRQNLLHQPLDIHSSPDVPLQEHQEGQDQGPLRLVLPQLPEPREPQHQQPYLPTPLLEHNPNEDEFQFPPQPYAFRFNIADGVKGVRFAHVGQGDEAGRVRGSYSYVRPDGVLFTVRYIADENGFHPELIEEEAPRFTNDPIHGTASFTVALPHADEFGVRVTAQELSQYRKKQEALEEAQQAAEGQHQGRKK